MKRVTRLKIVLIPLYALIVLLIIVLLMGKLIRVVYDRKQSVSFPDYDQVRVFDPTREGGHLLPDLNLLVASERRGEGVRFITNSKGFRNTREFDYIPAERTFRILLIGDSYVDGLRTDQTKTMGFLLEKELNEKKPYKDYDNYEVIVAGNDNPTNAWYYYQEHGHKYNPHLVLLGITIGNDLTWNTYRSTFTPVRKSDGSLTLEWTKLRVQRKQNAKGLLLPDDAYTVKGFFDFLKVLERKARDYLAWKYTSFAYEVPPLFYPYTSFPRQCQATDTCVSLGLFYVPLMPQIEAIYSDFEETLREFHRTVQTNNSTLAIVLFPTAGQMSGKEWALLKDLYFLEEKKFDLGYPNARILEFCKKNNIVCSDVLPVFRKTLEKNPAARLFRFRGDMHYNENGQELAASELSQLVTSIAQTPAEI